ncbi:hypothetical protein WA026_005547 [Henosepilachna vigintioctopunctata]|uniref:Uncharacterized protein n=1 Tax=Henosepilachna vigintioctopunctata TaxID=420089 RepID=A0AAW1U255_9CUCU
MICNNILRKLSYFCHLIEFAIKWTIRNFQAGRSDSLACLTDKTAIVTGGSRGIGYAISVLLASRGCRVIIACRGNATEAKEEIIKVTSNKNITIAKLDLSSLKSIREFAENIKVTHEKIDILINNAGVGALTQKVTEDGLNATMQTNFFGSFLLTHLLLEPLKASGKARVVFTTSGLGAIHNLTLDNINMTNYEINFGTSKDLYCNSKLCNTLAGHQFSKRLRDHHIMVNTYDTGAAQTDIYKNAINETGNWGVRFFTFITGPFQRDKFDAAQSAFHLATSEKLNEETGKLYFRCKPLLHPMIINDEKFCDEIWKKTENWWG